MTALGEIPHGTRPRYRKGCRCEPCTVANAQYTAYRRRLACGVEPTPDEVRDHLAKLTSSGLGTARIAELAGVTKRTVMKIQAGSGTKPDTANRILAVPISPANGALIDGAETWQMIEAIFEVKGRSWLAQRMDPDRRSANFSRRRLVRSITAQKVAAIYAELGLPPLAQPESALPVPAGPAPTRSAASVSDVAAGMLDLEPSPWKSKGACRRAGTDPQWWTSGEAEDTARAKAACARCEVRAECLAYALALPERYFVWGGTTARERRRMRAGGRGARVEAWEDEEEGAA